MSKTAVRKAVANLRRDAVDIRTLLHPLSNDIDPGVLAVALSIELRQVQTRMWELIDAVHRYQAELAQLDPHHSD